MGLVAPGGWQDFARVPQVSLAFGLVIAAMSIVLIYGLWQQEWFAYTFPLAAGFMFVAPFLGIAFYEISRRLEMGAPVHFHDVAVAWRKRPGRIFTLGPHHDAVPDRVDADRAPDLRPVLWLGRGRLERLRVEARHHDRRSVVPDDRHRLRRGCLP